MVTLALLFSIVAACDRETELAESGPDVSSVSIDTARMATYELVDAPVVRIGSVDGDAEQELFRVVGALSLANGRLAVANEGSHEIRFYDPGGALSGSVGRKGKGPGEFDLIRTFSRLQGDTLGVYDSRLGRVTIVSPTGSVIRTTGVPRDLRPGLASVSPAGSLVQRVESADGFSAEARPDGIWIDTSYILVHDREGRPVTEIGPIPGRESVWLDGFSAQRPFGHWIFMALGETCLYVGSGKPGTIERYEYTGKRLGPLVISRSPVSVTEADKAAWIESFVEGVTGDYAVVVERLLNHYPPPEQRPVYEHLLVDRGDRLWVKLYNPPWDAAQEWWVVDAKGDGIARVRLPAKYRLLDADLDAVVTLSTDAADVEQIGIFPLRRVLPDSARTE